MPADSISVNEDNRLEALRALNLLDTPPEERFDRITRLGARLLGVPAMALILVDEHRLFFKSRYGMDTVELDRAGTFCDHAILEDKQFIIPDAKLDPRFANHPSVTGKPFFLFYFPNPVAAST